MNTIIKNIALALSLCSAYPTQAQVGQRCEPGDIPPRPGLTCQATGEWEYQPSYILNAKKGEIILSSANGMIGGVLRHVSPPQRYSHSGMIVQRAPMLVRHSTASEERYKDHVVSVGEGIVANYIEPAVLQYG